MPACKTHREKRPFHRIKEEGEMRVTQILQMFKFETNDITSVYLTVVPFLLAFKVELKSDLQIRESFQKKQKETNKG